jgi:hypothetical protein
MLTLCLLAAMAAFTWPALENSFASQRLRAGANRVRAQWIRARTEAMNSDATYLFRYTLGGSQFCIESRPDPDAIAEQSFGDGSGGGSGLPDPSLLPRKLQGTLPDGVTFAASQITPDTRAATVAAESDLGSQAAPNELEPILFFPDGTTSTAQLRLKNDRGRCIDLSLRGLTGVATVSDVFLAEQQMP